MRDLKKQERTAIDSVARRFSATWEKGRVPPHAYLTVAGKRVAVDVATLKRRGAGQGHAAKPRLRFDKAVTRVMGRLRATLGETVPDGMTVVLTLTAPIRLPSKTAGSLEDKVRTLLGRGSPGARERRGAMGPHERRAPGGVQGSPPINRDEKSTIHGNRVRIRLLRDASGRAQKLIGFVHNSDSDPLLLLNMTRGLLELLSAEAGRRAPRPAGDRWLVVMSAEGIPCLEAYRDIYSQLRLATDFKKVLIVFRDGRAGALTG